MYKYTCGHGGRSLGKHDGCNYSVWKDVSICKGTVKLCKLQTTIEIDRHDRQDPQSQERQKEKGIRRESAAWYNFR